jgi:hypothetical protein
MMGIEVNMWFMILKDCNVPSKTKQNKAKQNENP